jgi:hypothetical protein
MVKPEGPEHGTKFTIENGYILYTNNFCVLLRKYGYLVIQKIGEANDPSQPRNMSGCMHIGLEEQPAAFPNYIILRTKKPLCLIETDNYRNIGPPKQVQGSEPPSYYIKAGISEPGGNSCPDVRLPDASKLLIPDPRLKPGSVLTMQSTKERWLMMI